MLNSTINKRFERKAVLLFALLIISGLTTSRAQQNIWTQKADFGGTAREDAVGFSIGGKGYIGTGDASNDFWEYDPVTNAWTQKADFGGTARHAAVGFSIGNKGYIGTGYNDSSGNPLNDFWEYDPFTNSWIRKADFGGGARYSSVGFSIGSNGYIGTGENSNLIHYKDFWEYDPSTNAWTQKADFGGIARVMAVGFSIFNKGYIGTGDDSYGYSYKDFWEYDPSTNAWTQKADCGVNRRAGAVGFSIGIKGYIGTGADSHGFSYNKDFWEYDPSTNAWTQKADFGGTVRYFGAVGFSIGGKGYIGTGFDGSDKNDFWEYTPVCNGLTVYADADRDGYGDAANTLLAADCVAPNGYVYDSTDCNDANAAIHPGAIDTCNGIDDNCNGITDESCGNTITTSDVSGSPFCPEATVSVPFTSSGTFVNGNIYTAQLSDHNGNFSSPTLIGTLISSANSDTITATIPSNPDGGIKYRIRVTGSIPLVDGTDNGQNLKLNDCGKVTALFVSGITATSATLSWTGVSCFSKYKVEYRKKGDSTWIKPYSTSDNYTLKNLLPNTNYEFAVQTFCSESGSSHSTFTTTQTFTTAVGNGDIWIQKADFGGTARQQAVGFSIGNKGYIGTGIADGSYRNDFWEYDPTADTWSGKANFGGSARHDAVGFSIGSKGYFGTGVNLTGPLNDWWEFTPDVGWTQKADFAGTARYSAVGFSVGDKGYVGTGIDANGTYQNDLWEYDVATNTWTQKTDFAGTARGFAVGFSIGSNGYIGTGNDGSYQNDFWEYDPASDSWTQKSNFGGTARYGAVGFSIDTNGYIGTGRDSVNRNDFWEYDPSTNSWIRKADFGGTARSGSVGFSIGRNGYIGTGYDNSDYTKDFWEYFPECNEETFYADADSDGYGNAASSIVLTNCDFPNGYVLNSTDCNDTNPNVNPGEKEIPNNGIDDNCNGLIDEFGTGIPTVKEVPSFSIYPNPVDGIATIQFTLSKSSRVIISVIDLSGKEITTILNDEVMQGDHSLPLNTSHFAKGIYVIRMITDDGIENKKFIIQ